MSRIIDTRALYAAEWRALVRLARWHGLSVADGEETHRRRYRLVNALIRKLDAGALTLAQAEKRLEALRG